MARHFAANAITALIAVCVALVGLALWAFKSFDDPGPLAETRHVMLERGVTLNEASDLLLKEGVISNGTIFRLGAQFHDVDDKLKFGEYEIPARASMKEVLDIVVSGRSIQYRITVAEGLTSWEVVQLLNASDVLTGEIGEAPEEGALAPDTYFVQRGSSRQELIKRMEDAQTRILEAAWEMRDPNIPIASPEEALILASIIEKETGIAAERPMVGAVFANRLRNGMQMQSDPTIIYGITNGQGPLDRPLTRTDILKPTDYNTYVIDRLPPGPICNPGRDAILAAVKPAESEALYFVADGTGGHVFSNNLRDHNRNVAEWRKIERQQKRQSD